MIEAEPNVNAITYKERTRGRSVEFVLSGNFDVDVLYECFFKVIKWPKRANLHKINTLRGTNIVFTDGLPTFYAERELSTGQFIINAKLSHPQYDSLAREFEELLSIIREALAMLPNYSHMKMEPDER